MNNVGIEAINAYCGQTALDVKTLFQARNLDLSRFSNLLMEKKAVGLPCEDPVTNAVNAAKPIIDALSAQERDRIELLITSTESGLDFGKSLSTYIHPHLNLSKQCRSFEVKQACYGGTAALQMAAHWVLSGASPGAKALVIATDCARASTKLTYAEPSQGVAAIAMLISNKPEILALDIGANGCHSYDVLDTCRPLPDLETGDADLSLLSYLDCLENCYKAYCDRVDGVDVLDTFSYLVFHTPFAGMVKGAHRNLLRKFAKVTPELIEQDFQQRVAPSLIHSVQVGNAYSASAYLALCSLIDNVVISYPQRIGIYSYGSGCSSEFYSGVLQPTAKAKLNALHLSQAIANRFLLDMANYDKILDLNLEWFFGVKDKVVDLHPFKDIYEQQFAGKGLLVLDKVVGFKRHYRWS